MAKKLAVKQPKILRYEELEQRVLFSADAVPGLDIDGVHEQVLTEDAGGDPMAAPGERGPAEEQTEEAPGPELVFVNGNVADYGQLIANLKESNEDRIIEVVVIDSHEDGIGLVTQTLAGRSDLSAVHFITHGANGQINLGNAWLNSTALEQNSHAVTQWGNALAETGDFLFYGCNIAADNDGQSLLDRISQLTGADVAASEDMTGNGSQGGDWDLEYRSGPVETKLSIRSDPQHGWPHLLNVNQGPVNTVPGAQDLTQNGMLLFSSTTGTQVSISDPDAGDNPVQVTLTATNGTLNLPGNGGLTFTDGSGTADATMTFTGTIADINIAMEGMSFLAVPGFTGTAGVNITTNDLGQTGTGGQLSASNGITINVAPDPDNSLWLSSVSDAEVGAPFGNLSWTNGEIIQFGNPNLALSQDENAPETNGTFTSLTDFSVDINALHHVTQDLIIGGGADTLQLLAGDLLFSTKEEETFGALTVTKKDVVLFRPTTPGDYSAGTFTMVLENPANDIGIRGISLVQQDTTVGSATPVTLSAGDFLFTLEGGASDKSVWRYEPTGVGQGKTAGDLTEFIEGDSAGVGISQKLYSVHLVQEDTTIGGIKVAKGEILTTVSEDDDVGSNDMAVTKYDVFRLSVESTGVGTSVAQASLLFDGSDVDISSGGEEFDGLTLGGHNQPPQLADQVFNAMDEHSAVDASAGQVTPMAPEPPLSYTITAGNTGGAFHIDTSSGEIRVANSAALDFETTPTFVLTVAAIDSQGVYDTATVTIPLGDINDPPVIVSNTGSSVIKGSTGNIITTAMLKTEDLETSPPDLFYILTGNVGKGTLKLDGTILNEWDVFSQSDIDEGKLTYDHGGADTLDDSFNFRVEDTDPEHSNKVPGTFAILVNAIRIEDLTAPIEDNAPNGTVVADINEAVTGNDTNLEGDPLTYSITAGNGDGVFTIDPGTGIITIADNTSLDHGATPSYALTVKVSDGSKTDTATITVNVTDGNSSVGPVSDNNPAGNTVPENANTGDPVGITALATDPDPGDTVTYSLSNDAGGLFAIDSGTGVVTVAGNLDYDAAASHTITVQADGSDGSTSSRTFTITITPVNKAPTAANAGFHTLEDTVFNGKIPTATDPDGDPLTYTLDGSAGYGTAVVNPDGSFSYTPDPDFNGMDSFTYTVWDGQGGADTATVTITINPVNDTPMAANSRFTTLEDTVFNGKLPTASDPDGDPLTYTLEDTPGKGTCVVNPDGSFTYTPDPDVNGRDAFTYAANDGHGGIDTGTVTIDITPVKDMPMAADAGYKTQEDTVCNGNLPAAADPDGDPLTYTLESAPGNGTCVVNPDGSFTYTPDPDANGRDAFTYAASDGHGGIDTGTVTIDITPANDMPMAAHAGYKTLEDTVCNGNLPAAADPDGDPLTYTLESAPGNGTCVVNPDGSFTYTPDPDANGTDTFTYTVSDGKGGTDTGTATIDITPVNDVPIAANASFNGLEDTVRQGNLPVAADPDGDPLTYTLESAPRNGTCVVNPDGSFTYTPDPDVNGRDAFTYAANDGHGGIDTGTVTIDITPVKDMPMAADAGYKTQEDTVCNGNLPAAADPDGDPLTYTLESAPGNGTCVVNPDGSFTYTPDPDANGRDAFTYAASDGHGGIDTGTVTIDITPANDMPMAAHAGYKTLEDTVCNGNLPAAADPDGDPLTYTLESAPGNGTCVVNPDGSFTYTPDPDANGTDTFTYTVSDGKGGTDTGTATIDITPVNDVPIAANASFNGLEDTVRQGNLPQARDADGDPVTYTLEKAAGKGTCVVNPDGSFDYTPNPDINGMDTFTYTVSDGKGAGSTYTVSIHVAPVKDTPTFTSEPLPQATEATAYCSAVTTENVDGTPLTISAPTLPSWLTLVDNGDGTATLSGTPTRADKGDHSVSIEVSNDGLTNTLDFNINVFVTTTGVTGSDSGQVINDPENNTDENPAEEDQTPEKTTPAPPAEYETMTPVEGPQAPGDPAATENSAVPVRKTAAGPTEENRDPPHKDLTDTPSKASGENHSPLHFGNDLYREISSLKYSSFNYTTGKNAPAALDGDEFTSLDFNKNDHNRIEINRDYDLLRQEIDQSFDSELNNRAFRTKLLSITSATFTFGIISFLLRAGSLMASLVSSLPVWRGFDPIAVFSGSKNPPRIKTDDISDADELKAESLFDGEAE